MTSRAIPIRRGCGERKQGGVYAECGLSPFGRPLEDFLMDPPVPIDAAGLGVAPIGVTLLADPANGATHVLDWVGEDFYPNVTDMLEEVRRFGLSRRLPRTLDFSRLDGRSRIMLIHSRALLLDPGPYLADRQRPCPTGLPEHQPPAEPTPHCAALWWEDVRGGELEPGDDPRLVRRTMPSFAYAARRAPDDAAALRAAAIFASFPVSRLVVIEDPEGGTHEAALASAAAANLPLDLVEA